MTGTGVQSRCGLAWATGQGNEEEKNCEQASLKTVQAGSDHINYVVIRLPYAVTAGLLAFLLFVIIGTMVV